MYTIDEIIELNNAAEQLRRLETFLLIEPPRVDQSLEATVTIRGRAGPFTLPADCVIQVVEMKVAALRGWLRENGVRPSAASDIFMRLMGQLVETRQRGNELHDLPQRMANAWSKLSREHQARVRGEIARRKEETGVLDWKLPSFLEGAEDQEGAWAFATSSTGQDEEK